MFARALIVLLIAINLGVAMWWLLRPDVVAPAAAATPPGVPRLQLLSEAKPLAASAPAQAAPVAAAQTPPPPAAPNQCFSLGPFADAAAMRAAETRLRPQVVRLRAREAAAAPARAYSVVLPPFASRELAQAATEKIKAAGFDDYLLINTGDDANGIALGRYGSQDTAQRRQAALRAAGFDAQIRPVGEAAAAGPSWLDIEARADADRARLRQAAGAAQSPALDCARLR
ncbi:SPOR domain-containing protein [Luteimonas gilva]|uniref:SPOR domain-containing protein n=1 Tax=Luteimonas gilva TaxID=2572684 RepID=A0A4U5JKK6_9GAMM|nr:SPOR domain-containing protein [Luteimonas gilva]TKR29615.1 SPOR domain-containing protein [Luteimonas gilva]